MRTRPIADPVQEPEPGSARSRPTSTSTAPASSVSRAARPAAKLPPPLLLGAFDPVLLGWTSREPLLGRNEGRIVGDGMFRPFALVGGRAAGVWSLRDGKVALDPFRRLTRRDAAALEAHARDVERHLF